MSKTDTDHFLDPCTWHRHFSDLYAIPSDLGPNPTVLFEGPSCFIQNPPLQFSTEETALAIATIKLGNTSGPDKIPGNLLKHAPEIWVPYVNLLSNAVARGAPIPESWKGAESVPIYKKGRRDDPANYRPIGVINTLQKVYAKQILGKLNDWILENDVLSPCQDGFRLKTSTIDQVYRLSCLAWKYTKLKLVHLYVAFIDLKAAFDSIPRDLLWGTLRQQAVPEEILKQIVRFHEGNFAKVRWGTGGEPTEEIPVSRGIWQGCINPVFTKCE